MTAAPRLIVQVLLLLLLPRDDVIPTDVILGAGPGERVL